MKENITKIGLLAGSLKGAGAEKTILTLADFLVRKNCIIDLFLLNEDADYMTPNGVNIIHLNGKRRNDKIFQLKNITNNSKYDLFITSRADYYDYVASKHKFVSVHITPYSWVKNEKKNFISKYLKLLRIKNKYRNKRLIALSEGIKNELIRNLACEPENITVINNPFDIDNIYSESIKLGPLPKNDYIIYVGSFIRRKRHKDLLYAFSKLNTTLDLVFVGKGPCEDELKTLAHSLNLSDRVIFWGWDRNPYRLIKNAKLSVLTSEAEGLPRTLIESLLLGTPTISTDCPSGPSEVMTKPFDQYLAPVGNIDKISEVMELALNNYPSIKLLNMDRFAADRVAARYLSLMKDHS